MYELKGRHDDYNTPWRKDYRIPYKKSTVSMSNFCNVSTNALDMDLVRFAADEHTKDHYTVTLTPFSEKRDYGCCIDIPGDIKTLDLVIQALTNFRNCIKEKKDPGTLLNKKKEEEN